MPINFTMFCYPSVFMSVRPFLCVVYFRILNRNSMGIKSVINENLFPLLPKTIKNSDTLKHDKVF
jgi:hypothetical protein